MAWTYPINFDPAQLITVAMMNTYHRDNMRELYSIVAKQTSDVTKNNSASFSDLPGMSFAVTSGEVWSFHVWSYFVSNATADVKYTVTAPAASTGRFGLAGHGIPLTAGNETTFGNPIAWAVGNTDNMTTRLSGYITAGANGTVQIQGAQNTATVVDTIFQANSFIVAHRASI